MIRLVSGLSIPMIQNEIGSESLEDMRISLFISPIIRSMSPTHSKSDSGNNNGSLPSEKIDMSISSIWST